MFFNYNFELLDKLNNNLLVQVLAYISYGFYVTAKQIKVYFIDKFLNWFIETSCLAKFVQLPEIEIWKSSFSWQNINLLACNLIEYHIIWVISLKWRFSYFVVSVLASGAERHDSGNGYIEGFLLVSVSIEFSFLIRLVSLLIINFESNSNGFGIICVFDDIKNCAMIPSTKGLLTVNDIPDFKIHSPLEIIGLGGIGCNFEWIFIDGDGSVMNVIKVFDF